MGASKRAGRASVDDEFKRSHVDGANKGGDMPGAASRCVPLLIPGLDTFSRG
jgi:hypothetical protein